MFINLQRNEFYRRIVRKSFRKIITIFITKDLKQNKNIFETKHKETFSFDRGHSREHCISIGWRRREAHDRDDVFYSHTDVDSMWLTVMNQEENWLIFYSVQKANGF